MKTLVFGHKNPDTDSVCASISYAYLKDKLNEAVEPRVLGEIRNEAKFVLDYFKVKAPAFLDNVWIQAKDLDYEKILPLTLTSSIYDAFKTMEKQKIHTLPIIDDVGKLIGIVSMQDIASGLFYADYDAVDSTLSSLIRTFCDDELNLFHTPKAGLDIALKGNLEVFDSNSFSHNNLNEDTVVILEKNYRQDFFENLNHSLGLLILSGIDSISEYEKSLIEKYDIPVLSVNVAIAGVVTKITHSRSIESIMKKSNIVKFTMDDYLNDIKDITLKTKFRNYPLLDHDGKYIGFIGRRHLIRPGRKNVILVDHNEFHQSANGIDEANILEVVDHHRIGGFKTVEPIQYISKTVGSTCTIIHQMFKDAGIMIPYDIAGLLISGILSDTLHFKSPTCTKYDIDAANSLNKILKLDLDNYTNQMFKEGSSIKGLSLEQILNNDLKEFTIKGKLVAISQIFTLDIDYIDKISEELVVYLEKLAEQKGYFNVVLAVTDIVKEGSYIYYYADSSVIKNALGTESKQGVFAPYLVSRKKQILPELTRAFEEAY